MTFAYAEAGDDDESYYDEDHDLGDDEEYVDNEDVVTPTIVPSPHDIPRPLQLNQEYDEWSSAMAPPVFTDKE